MTWQEALDLWKQHLSLRSAATARGHSAPIALSFCWADASLETLTAAHLEEWAWYLANRTNPASTFGKQITRATLYAYPERLKRFLLYSLKHGWLRRLSQEEFKESLRMSPATTTRPYEILVGEEITRILDAAPDLRARCILALGLFAGLRNAEILSLCPTQVRRDEQGAYLQIQGKGQKEATVPIDAALYALLHRYAEGRPSAVLLVHFGANRLRAIVATCARRAGIMKPFSPHSLRHRYAFLRLQDGVPLAVISKLLRYSNLTVTRRYLDHLSREEIAK